MHKEECTRRKDLSRQIWSRYPSVIESDRICTVVKPSELQPLRNQDSRGGENETL
jgi:hypothetical protein